MSAPQWLIVAAVVLVVIGLVEARRSGQAEDRGDLAAAYRSYLLSRGLAAVGVLLGAAGLIWEMTR
ncbi:hypothetical protein [Actinomycetospora corticicola]|uniref:Uncharacterized protein n=1 Tax=Actinomycetospora corticicola TaxID=663602 RepID=A0A7Y9DWQ0_9PSEU|nr:hypothetical protein [Actinomycetospora corticicola]NYD36794.1 hypothetical protein [Actinomycetospora corticicola]